MVKASNYPFSYKKTRWFELKFSYKLGCVIFFSFSYVREINTSFCLDVARTFDKRKFIIYYHLFFIRNCTDGRIEFTGFNGICPSFWLSKSRKVFNLIKLNQKIQQSNLKGQFFKKSISRWGLLDWHGLTKKKTKQIVIIHFKIPETKFEKI